MAAFDTALEPVSVTPASTSNATLDTADADWSVLIDVANTGTATISVRVGITPNGGSVHWKRYDVSVPAGDAFTVGPWFLRNLDAVTVSTNTSNDAVFSLTGVKTS